MTLIKFFKRIIGGILSCSLLVFLPFTAFADTGSGPGGSGQGGGGDVQLWQMAQYDPSAAHLSWVCGNNIPTPNPFPYTGGALYVNTWGGVAPEGCYVQQTSNTHNGRPFLTGLVAWNELADTPGGPYASAYGYAAWGTSRNTNDNANASMGNNVMGFYPSIIDARERDGWGWNPTDGVYESWRPGQKLGAVWITDVITHHTDHEDSIFTVKTDSPADTYQDRRPIQDIYAQPTKGKNYTHTTHKDVQPDNFKVNDVILHMTKDYDTHSNDPGHPKDWVDPASIKYSSSQTGNDRTFTYTVHQPTPPINWFQPSNLNRNGVAWESDYKQDFPNIDASKPPLNVTVNNNQNITDNSALPTLDLNKGMPFNINIGPNWGLPSWISMSAVKNLSSDITNYNGWDQVTSDNYESDKGNLPATKAVGSDAINHGGIDSLNASLTWNGNELQGPQVFNIPSDSKNRFTLKTITMGDYHLYSPENPKWWILNYSWGGNMFFGRHYEGNIDTNSINNPNVMNRLYDPDPRQGWVAPYAQQVYQPIVCGKFHANTVAGNDR